MKSYVDSRSKTGTSNHRRWLLGDSKILKATAKGLALCFKSGKYTKADYMEPMALLYDILRRAASSVSCSYQRQIMLLAM